MGRKIALIAPLPPFRGGIAQHSAAVAGTLISRKEVTLHGESFARLYPALLYPGSSDRDPAAKVEPSVASNYQIDTLNPWSWFTCARRIVAANVDLAIIPAWTFFTAPALGTIARALRRRGIEVVMVVHNVTDHEAAGWKQRLTRYQLRSSDRLVTHTESLAQELDHIVPELPVAVSPHPVYTNYPPATGTLRRRRALELLCFGLVRPYKGVDIALRGLAASGLRDVMLTIAGEFWENPDETRKLVAELGLSDRVEIIPRYVDDNEAAELFGRADVVLASYREVTGSGVVALAHNYQRPVIASDLPGFSGCIAHGRTGWFFPAGDHEAMGKLLATTINRDVAAEMASEISSTVPRDGWERFVAVLLGD